MRKEAPMAETYEQKFDANRCFVFTYEFDGSRWGGEVWASTLEEAEMKLKAMGRGTIDGLLGGKIPADGPLPNGGSDAGE